MNHDAYVSLLRSIDDLIRMLDRNPDERTREQVVALLGGVDALHREGLERLVARLREFGGDALVERLADDPVVHTFLGLYGFRELDVPEEEPEPAPAGGVVGFVPLDQVRIGKGSGSGDPPRSARGYGPGAASAAPEPGA